jgi:predicted secreted Zn-dependent protease
MDQFGPLDELGNRHDAYTEWYVNWSYPNLIMNENCTTGLIKVTITITYTLPKWKIPPDVSPTLVDKWTAYMNALQKHEDGHQQIAIDAGFEILQTLHDLPPYPSCAELERVADAAGEKLLNQFRQKEAAYDQTTNHGESQGSQFP